MTLRERAEKYALEVEWKGDNYGARKQYYADAYLAGLREGLEMAAKTADELFNGFHSPHEYSGDVADAIRKLGEDDSDQGSIRNK
jgi:hypothetical protein